MAGKSRLDIAAEVLKRRADDIYEISEKYQDPQIRRHYEAIGYTLDVVANALSPEN